MLIQPRPPGLAAYVIGLGWLHHQADWQLPPAPLRIVFKYDLIHKNGST